MQGTETRTADHLEMILAALATTGSFDESEEVHPMSDRSATAMIYLDGTPYSLTLNRED